MWSRISPAASAGPHALSDLPLGSFSTVELLKSLGNNLTRKNLMQTAANKLHQTDNPLILPGITIQTTSSDHFPIAQGQLEKWQGTSWQPFGSILSGRSS